jgi:hypothetical protein
MKNAQHLKDKTMPIWLSNTVRDYNNSGRLAFVHPRIRRISLNGGRQLTYTEAHEKISSCLLSEKKELIT